MMLVAAVAEAVAKMSSSLRIAQHVLVDGLVADSNAELEKHPAADLLGAPAEMQFLLDMKLESTLNLATSFALLDTSPVSDARGP
jgi:hypothetical protein